MWLVVVLPLVPDTSTTRRPWASYRSAPGCNAIVTRPPMIEPPPRPCRRDNPAAAFPARSASSPQACGRRARSPVCAGAITLRGTLSVVDLIGSVNERPRPRRAEAMINSQQAHGEGTFSLVTSGSGC